MRFANLLVVVCVLLLVAAGIWASTVPGRFGGGYDASQLVCSAAPNSAYSTFPLTAECWFKLSGSKTYNILLANRVKSSPLHWELFTTPGTGLLGAYFPGFSVGGLSTGSAVVDNRWHHAALVLAEKHAQLYLDGCMIASADTISPANCDSSADEGPFWVGAIQPEWAFCNGVIDEVRLSNTARTFSSIPSAPYQPDEHTISLWHFDNSAYGAIVPDATSSDESDIRILPKQLDRDRDEFGVTRSPWARRMTIVTWRAASPGTLGTGLSAGAQELLLHGRWDCTHRKPNSVSDIDMLKRGSRWTDAFAAHVPCSVQAALYEAGRIRNPLALKNNLDIEWACHREWWLRKTFAVPASWKGKRVKLCFDGVDHTATFWLNGRRIAAHRGMYGGPEVYISGFINYGGGNEIVVKIEPAPVDYHDTVKASVAYGWHYCRLITLGIWRPVRLQCRELAEMDHPFLRTTASTGKRVRTQMSLDVFSSASRRQTATFQCRLTPKNFHGRSFLLTRNLTLSPGTNSFGFKGLLEGARLWWPADMGDPCLYRMECVIRRGPRVLDRFSCNWGARSIEMRYIPGQRQSPMYPFQCVINGRVNWLRGATWCYPDALFRLTRDRQSRFLTMARSAHVQLVRVWGGGPVENDEFYDLCDELGVMVQQEFALNYTPDYTPTFLDEAADVAAHQVLRLRNHPSLAIWAGSNEYPGDNPPHCVIGKFCWELDGTRPFRRTCWYGGDQHWYGVYANRQPLLDYRSYTRSLFDYGLVAITEAGLASPADMETWKRILPESEITSWPIAHDSVFQHHVPTYDYTNIEIMMMYARDFLEPNKLPDLVEAMQLSHGLGLKFLMESMRALKPRTTATYVYKLTENYPACSWATIDQMGYAKRAHYMLGQANRPVHIMAVFDSWNTADASVPVQFCVVNDSATAFAGRVTARLYDGQLRLLSTDTYRARMVTDRAMSVGTRCYSSLIATSRPLFLCLTLEGPRGEIDRNFYYFDFTQDKGSLFNRPETTLSARIVEQGGAQYAVIRNTGKLPAVSVELRFGIDGDCFFAEDSGVWLDSGEVKRIRIFRTPAVDGHVAQVAACTVKAWNASAVTCRVPPPARL